MSEQNWPPATPPSGATPPTPQPQPVPYPAQTPPPGIPPIPGAPLGSSTPTAPGAIPAAGGAPVPGQYPPAGPPPKKSRTWLWVLLGVLGFLALLLVAFVVFVGAAVKKEVDKVQASASAAASSMSADAGADASASPDITVNSTDPITAVGSDVSAPCFTFTMPAGYELATKSAGCSAGVNIPGGDGLTGISVMANGGIGDVTQATTVLKEALSGNGTTITSIDVVTLAGGVQAVKADTEESTLLRRYYVIPGQNTYSIDGQVADGALVVGYAYNEQLSAAVDATANSLRLK